MMLRWLVAMPRKRELTTQTAQAGAEGIRRGLIGVAFAIAFCLTVFGISPLGLSALNGESVGIWATAWAASVDDIDEETAAFRSFVEALCTERAPSGSRRAVTDVFCSLEVGQVHGINDSGESFSLPVLVAKSSLQTQAGYQHIGTEVMAQTAILFLFDSDRNRAFHMCNVEEALDIVWIRRDGTILDIQRMEPGARIHPLFCTDVYSPRRMGAYRYALEGPPGLFAELGVSIAGSGRFLIDPTWQP